MAKRQSRKSISITGVSYARLKEHCQQHGKSMSSVVEVEVKKYLDANEVRKAG